MFDRCHNTPICQLAAGLVAVALVLYFGSYAGAITIDTVLIGRPGNADDVPYSSAGAFGAVDYAYEIGTYEVTNDQYVPFLNAVAANDFNSLYQSEMTNNSKGGIIRNGAPGSFSYEVKPNMGNKPVISVNLWDAARFVNWLHNGQPSGGQSDSTTEDGVYDLDGLAPSSTVTWGRKAGATWFIPTEDEWYKAAYYDPRTEAEGGPPGDDHYWRYPTQSDADPTAAIATETGDVANPGPNVANYDNAHWNGFDYNLTTVGSAGEESSSFFGTYDQGGNIAELTESPYQTGDFYVARGGGTGSMYSASRPTKISAVVRGGADPAVDHPSLGFRVAKLAEPIEVLAGDYNADGTVNAADYVTWRNHFGSSATLPGDETPGMVDETDYFVWTSNFGRTIDDAVASASHQVPEPGAVVLACGAYLAATARFRFGSAASGKK